MMGLELGSICVSTLSNLNISMTSGSTAIKLEIFCGCSRCMAHDVSDLENQVDRFSGVMPQI